MINSANISTSSTSTDRIHMVEKISSQLKYAALIVAVAFVLFTVYFFSVKQGGIEHYKEIYASQQFIKLDKSLCEEALANYSSSPGFNVNQKLFKDVSLAKNNCNAGDNNIVTIFLDHSK